MKKSARYIVLALLWTVGKRVDGGDWPQFMREPGHTGCAADEEIQPPLGLVAQVRLDDAVLTSPAVAGGLAYVVDQMGTAYCIDPESGRVVWKAAPDGTNAMGSNTSSPCVARGRMYYGTTAGTFHILECKDGKAVKTLKIGIPIISSPTFANDSIYFQALDGIVRCLDLDGNERWTWDHYKRYVEPPETTEREKSRRGHPGSYDRPHYGGGEVAVSGTKIVTSMGWDIFCLEDKGKEAELVWCRRCPSGRDGAAPMSSSISGEWVYTAGAGADGVLSILRLSLRDGSNAPHGVPGIPGLWFTPAVHGSLVATRDCGWLRDEVQVYEIGKNRVRLWQHPTEATPMIGSWALTRNHCVVGTLKGELLVLDLEPKPKPQPFIFKTPNGRGIGSSPSVSDGRIFFGCDDGFLYVLGPDGRLTPKKDEQLTICEPKSKVVSATGRAYGWPSPAADQGNTNFVDDPDLKPPFKICWAVRAFGHFKTPCIATEDGDLLIVTLDRTVTCLEQATGRMRWRFRFPLDAEQWNGSSGLLVEGGRVYVPVPNNRANEQKGRFYCLDGRTGEVIWSAEIGRKSVFTRSWPVVAAGKVAFSHVRKGPGGISVVQAWDADNGEPAWEVELKASAEQSFGVTDGKVFYFSAAPQYSGPRPKDKPGETVAIEGATGRILWRTDEVASGLQLSLRDGRLYLYDACAVCLSAEDGSIVWDKGLDIGQGRYISLGPDCYVLRGYGGHASRGSLADGKPMPFSVRSAHLGGRDHACGPVVLTPNLSVNVTVSGLHVRDIKTGELLWFSPGFAPRGCVNPSIANGRIFWPSSASGVVFCWEPQK